MIIKIIQTTTDSNKTAKHIADSLIKNKLSPCVQIISNIESIYKWQEKIKRSKETLLLIKTTPELEQDCKTCILKFHNYNIPENIVIDGEILNNKYKDWFLDELN